MRNRTVRALATASLLATGLVAWPGCNAENPDGSLTNTGKAEKKVADFEKKVAAGAKHAGEVIKEDATKAGEAIKEGAKHAGEVIKEDAAKAGEAIKEGAVKVKDGAEKAGEKIKDAVQKKD